MLLRYLFDNTVSESTRHLRCKTVWNSEGWAQIAEIATIMAFVLKILTNQITITFLSQNGMFSMTLAFSL